ncbi:GNAT family N-acetyltransferase [Oceanobacillus sp. CF4.6]|uniref:GNAT family N-acetyltransferase n=1 Tax=Oceanobacillus sp. CF4.6 TaxID=3373080 RepID=UPI003EE70772
MTGRELSLTENLIFRDLTMDDKYDIYCLYSDPEVLRLDHSEPFKDIMEAEELIRDFKQSNCNHSSISWGIELKDSKNIIGTCGFKNWDRLSHHADIGGNFLSEYWGKGFGTETLRFMIEYGFTKMYLNKICVYTNVKNTNVVKLMKRHDFQQEGILREHQLLEGAFEDVFVFSLLKKNYKFNNE